MTSSLMPLLAFGAVIALIPAVLWLLKRTPLGGGAAQGAMRVVAMLPLSPSQRLMTVEVGQGDERRWLVLGVSNAGIQALHTMAPQADAPVATATPAAPFASFAQLLSKVRGVETRP